MAGATNRAMKSAGVPKASIKTIRVKAGGRLTLQSAISIAREHGLDVGKAPEHLARREAKVETKRQAAQATAKAAQQGKVARSLGDAGKGMLAARKAEGERKAALQAASARRQTQVTGSVGAASKVMLAARKAGAKPSFDGAMTKFKAHAQKQIDDYYAANFPNSKSKPTLHYSDGEKYIRVTKVEPGQKTGSAHSFIDKSTGDVLKPDGFKRPAKGARGNILTGDYGVNHHGANYSEAYMKRRFATDFNAAPSKGGPSKQAIADARDVIMGPRKGAAKKTANVEPTRWKNAIDERPASVKRGGWTQHSLANAGGFHVIPVKRNAGKNDYEVVHPGTDLRIATMSDLGDAKKVLRAVASGRLEKKIRGGALPEGRTNAAINRLVESVQRARLAKTIEDRKNRPGGQRYSTFREEQALTRMNAERISGRRK